MRTILILMPLLLCGCGILAVATKKHPTPEEFTAADAELGIADQADDLLPPGAGAISGLILAALGAVVARKKLLASGEGKLIG